MRTSSISVPGRPTPVLSGVTRAVAAVVVGLLLVVGSASVAHALPPRDFNKLTPANGATWVWTSPTATWQADPNPSYEVCADTTNDGVCGTSWVAVGRVASVTWPGSALTQGATYYWQVRARNAEGTTLANGGAWWSFTVLTTPELFSRSFAEGAVSYRHLPVFPFVHQFFDTRFALMNPGANPTAVLMRFMRRDGVVVPLQFDMPARSRRTVDARAVFGLVQRDIIGTGLSGEFAEFSTTVESDAGLVVDRTMRWDDRGYGGHAETGVAAPALTWYLAEGATHSGFNLFYLLQNPNTVEAQVRVRYLRPTEPPLEKTYTLRPSSRTNIWVDLEEFPGLGAALASTDVSAVFDVLNGQPIIVERAMYLDVPGQAFGAGHESAGVTAPALGWFLAEGATGPYFDLFVLISNPGGTDADVEATYLLPDGTTVVKPYTVAANSRFNIWVDQEGGRLADTAVSTTIRSTNDVPVIVERAMWWPDGGWYEAHNSPGATTTGTTWALAEGEVDASRNLETYILVANTSPMPADVKVTLLFEDGTSAEQTYAGIPAKSRFNVPVGSFFPQASGKRFGSIVESLGATPAQIVVERAMYWDAGGVGWAAGTNALATKLQ